MLSLQPEPCHGGQRGVPRGLRLHQFPGEDKASLCLTMRGQAWLSALAWGSWLLPSWAQKPLCPRPPLSGSSWKAGCQGQQEQCLEDLEKKQKTPLCVNTQEKGGP